MGKMYKNLEPTFNYLKELLNKDISKKQYFDKMSHKNMLLNTALFVFPHTQNPGKFLFELYSQNENIVTTMSPHLYRYYVVAALLQDQTISTLKNDSYQELFLTTLLEEFDFESSFKQVSQVQTACSGDFFTRSLAEHVAESCQKQIVATYAQIHDSINVNSFSGNLGKSGSDGTKFIESVLEKSGLAHKLSEDKAEIKLSA